MLKAPLEIIDDRRPREREAAAAVRSQAQERELQDALRAQSAARRRQGMFRAVSRGHTQHQAAVRAVRAERPNMSHRSPAPRCDETAQNI